MILNPIEGNELWTLCISEALFGFSQSASFTRNFLKG